ncbi:MAG: hypothetical protein ABI681_06070 [Gemmatimonadales bacterium]
MPTPTGKSHLGASMKTALPSVPDMIFLMAASIFGVGGAVRLTQSDGDLAAHIRMGEWIIAMRQLPAHSLASYTVGGEALVAPAWLSEVLFALLFRAGGLPLIAIVTGLVIGLTHGLIALFLRRRGVDPRIILVGVIASVFLGASHWLARPHMFSIPGALITLLLLESGKPRTKVIWFFPLFALWANLHGGWLFGLMLIGAYTVAEAGEAWLGTDRQAWLDRARAHAVSLAVAAMATLANPYGVRLYREVFGAVTSVSLATSIDEYMSPNFHELANLPLLAAILTIVAVLALTPRRMPLPWLAVSGMGLLFALNASRNVALFGVTAVPLLVLYASGPARPRTFPLFADFARREAEAGVGRWALAVTVLLLALGLNRGSVGGVSLIADRFDAKKFPVEAVRRSRDAGLQGRIFDPWIWGGYMMYAWPGSALHVDPLKFSQLTIDSHTRIESLRPGWKSELARWNVELAIVETGSELDSALSLEPDWTRWYKDSTAVVLRRKADETLSPQRE